MWRKSGKHKAEQDLKVSREGLWKWVAFEGMDLLLSRVLREGEKSKRKKREEEYTKDGLYLTY